MEPGTRILERIQGCCLNVRDGIKKAKAQLKLNLARGVKNSEKGFYGYIDQKRKIKEIVPPQPSLINKRG